MVRVYDKEEHKECPVCGTLRIIGKPCPSCGYEGDMEDDDDVRGWDGVMFWED